MNPYSKPFFKFIFVSIMAIMISITSSFLFKSKFYVSNDDAFRACDVARSKEIPYHVAIVDRMMFHYRYRGGGALIHEKYVLTLMTPYFKSIEGSDFMANLKVIVGARTIPGDGIIYEVEKFIYPPSYNTTTGTDNIALIKLKKNEESDNDVHPIALPDKGNTIKEGVELFGSGFNLKGNSMSQSDLRKFSMQVVSIEKCRKYFAERHLNFTGKFCAVAALGHRPCLSDMGSPAANVNRDYVIGIHTVKKDECDEEEKKKKKPELFVDVTSYLDFIKSSIVTD